MNKKNPHTGGSAAGIRWNLGDYYTSPDDPAVEKDLKKTLHLALAFEKNYKGIFDRKPEVTGAVLARIVKDYEEILALRDRPYVYAYLLFSGNTQEPAYGRMLQMMQQRSTEISKHLIFMNLEWCAIDEKKAQNLVNDKQVALWKHFLQALRRYKPHLLSEPEEKIVDELENTGSVAFIRLFDEMLGAARFTVQTKGKTREISEEEALSRLYDSDRETRKAAAKGLTEGFNKLLKPLTFIFNNLVQYHSTQDRLRKYVNPMANRNLSNEINGKAVDALLKTCDENNGLVARYYRLKARLLGLKTLYDYDRYAPISGDLPTCTWKEAREMVGASYRSFSPELGGIVDDFFSKHWIDAELRPGKRSGAFCAGGTPDVHPYIQMNYNGHLRDVSTLAHELGHGVHQSLSNKQGYLQADTPLTLAETASVFGEMLTFQRLMETQKDPRVKLALICSKIEDVFATVFRQACMTRFEQKVHQARRKEGELTPETIAGFWMEANQAMFGNSVKLTESYGCWWSYIGHFIRSPFYCYAYSFGELLVLSLYALYRKEGKDFVPKYIELLSAGGTDSPEALARKMGLDISKPSFWKQGMGLIAGMVEEAEALAAGLKPSKKK